MNYSDTAPADPSALSLWPDASAFSEEEINAWAQAAGYAKPAVDDSIPQDVPDATLAWGQSGTSFAEPLDLQNNFDFNWMLGGTVASNMASQAVPPPNAPAMGMLAPATMPAFNNNTNDAYTDLLFPGSDFPISRTPSLTTDSSIPSPQSDGPINELLGFPYTQAGPSSFVQPKGPPFPLDAAGALNPNQLTCAPPTSFMGGGNLAGVQDFDPLGLLDDLLFPGSWDFSQPTSYLAPPTDALTTMVTPGAGPSTSLGKRSRQSDDKEPGGPEKRSRPSRVPGGAQSTKRTRRSPATRTQTIVNSISKAAGPGAERLGSTTARGVYHRPLSGLHVPQGSVGALEQEMPSWIVGSEVVESRRDMGSSAPEQMVLQENTEDEEKLLIIPAWLMERGRLMLQMTQAEKERGAVSVIRCKLCPDEQFLTWEIYGRHCDTCEMHPSQLVYCSTCSDYFGRTDSMGRHNKKKNPEACLSTSPDDAREKKEKVERLLKAFNSELTERLKNGLEFNSRFSKVVARKLENSSKKVSRTEEIWSEDDSWADGLW